MGLLLEVYKNPLFTNCSNGGVTATANSLVAVNLPGPFEPGPGKPAVLLVAGNSAGLAKLIPAKNVGTVEEPVWVEDKPEGALGPMNGGAFASGDSRFAEAVAKITGHRTYSAIPVHDRYESPELYKRLST